MWEKVQKRDFVTKYIARIFIGGTFFAILSLMDSQRPNRTETFEKLEKNQKSRPGPPLKTCALFSPEILFSERLNFFSGPPKSSRPPKNSHAFTRDCSFFFKNPKKSVRLLARPLKF